MGFSKVLKINQVSLNLQVHCISYFCVNYCYGRYFVSFNCALKIKRAKLNINSKSASFLKKKKKCININIKRHATLHYLTRQLNLKMLLKEKKSNKMFCH